MGNCKDCRFWDKLNDYGEGKCTKIRLSYSGDQLDLYPNGMVGGITVVTPELFGCNKFKARDE